MECDSAPSQSVRVRQTAATPSSGNSGIMRVSELSGRPSPHQSPLRAAAPTLHFEPSRATIQPGMRHRASVRRRAFARPSTATTRTADHQRRNSAPACPRRVRPAVNRRRSDPCPDLDGLYRLPALQPRPPSCARADHRPSRTSLGPRARNRPPTIDQPQRLWVRVRNRDVNRDHPARAPADHRPSRTSLGPAE